MSASIRPATPADSALVLALIRELAAYEKLLHEVEASEEMIAGSLFGANPRVFADIAEWQGQPAGFALWFYNFSTFQGKTGIYLEDLFVRPAFRGKGLGKILLSHLAKRCLAENLGRLQWSVLDWNTPSIDFYKAQGAVMTDEWTGCRVSGAALRRLAEAGP